MHFLIVFGAKYLIIVPVLALLWSSLALQGKKRTYLLLLTMVALPIALGVGKALSYVYYNTRPFVAGAFTPLIDHAPDNGFPSDHMLLAATLATLVFFINSRLGAALWVVAVLIGVSRVAAGVHHPLDIVASGVVAVVAVFGAHFLLFWQRKLFKK